MADVEERFAQAQIDARDLRERPGNDTLLRLYALYKQGSEGDAGTDRPGFFDFVGTAKYEAWTRLSGTSRDDAQRQYVELVRTLTG